MSSVANQLSVPGSLTHTTPAILGRAGEAAQFAAAEFFFANLRNPHTRSAYAHAIRRFLEWADERSMELGRISPADVGRYMDGLKKANKSVATCKQHLAALRQFFDN